MVRNVTVPLVQSWYEDWKAPDFDGDRQHDKRAYEGASTFRQVIYFLASMRKYAGTAQLAAELKLVVFEADASGAQFADIQLAMTHKNPAMTRRYIRSGPASRIDAVAEARARKRATDRDGTA